MLYIFWFDIELDTGKTESFHVRETDLGRAWLQCAMKFGPRAKAIKLQFQME